MVTAETAVALPAVVVVLALGLWALACVSAQLRCVDAAAAAARVAARGDPAGSPAAAAARLAPPGSTVRVLRQGSRIEVDVSVAIRPFGRRLRLPGITVTGRATAVREPLSGVRLVPP